MQMNKRSLQMSILDRFIDDNPYSHPRNNQCLYTRGFSSGLGLHGSTNLTDNPKMCLNCQKLHWNSHNNDVDTRHLYNFHVSSTPTIRNSTLTVYQNASHGKMSVNLMMTSSNGNIFRVTGPLCGEFTGHRWIPLTKASDAVLWCFLWSAPVQTTE